MSLIEVLEPWEYRVSGGFKLRGFHSVPSGKPLIHFMHGNGFCGLAYEKMLEPLLPHFDLFISDSQGHGDSDAGEQGYAGWRKSAAYALEAWQAFSGHWRDVPNIASGHSYGGILTSLIMAQKPGLFDRAVLLDPTFAPSLASHTWVLMSQVGLAKHMTLPKQARARSTRWENDEELWQYFHHRGVFKGWDDDCLRSYLTHAMHRDSDGVIHLKCPPEIEASIFSTYPQWLWRSLRKVRDPVTILYGDKTFGFLLKALPKLRKTNPMFDMIEMPGSHCFMQEDPAASSAKILELLKA